MDYVVLTWNRGVSINWFFVYIVLTYNMRVVVKFYLGQNEDYRLGNSISESSEELLQRGRKDG